jgi:hypothetical protein
MKTVSLTVLLACVAVTFVQACDAEQVVADKAATMDAIKLEKSRQMQRNRAIEEARQAAAAAEHVKTIPRPISATSQKERQEQMVAKLEAAAEMQRMKYKSIKEMNDRIAHRYRVHAEEKMRPPQKEPKPKPPRPSPPTLNLQENEVNPVRVDSEAIVQNAKKAVERARNLPKSFKEWEARMKQKMTARSHQQTAAKQNSNNIRVVSPAAVTLASPAIRNDLVKEIEMEGEMMKSHAPYHHVGRSQVINQAARPRDPKTYPMPLPQEQKAWENAVQARLEAIKANPNQWEEMRKRVEEKVEMSGPRNHDYPSPPRHRYPYHSY